MTNAELLSKVQAILNGYEHQSPKTTAALKQIKDEIEQTLKSYVNGFELFHAKLYVISNNVYIATIFIQREEDSPVIVENLRIDTPTIIDTSSAFERARMY